jgi:hypothetical protein
MLRLPSPASRAGPPRQTASPGSHPRRPSRDCQPLDAGGPHWHCHHTEPPAAAVETPPIAAKTRKNGRSGRFFGSIAKFPSRTAESQDSPCCYAGSATGPRVLCLFLRYFSWCLTLPRGSANFLRSASRCH